jgi:putative nucleotidyltransferase with HDIG domain
VIESVNQVSEGTGSQPMEAIGGDFSLLNLMLRISEGTGPAPVSTPVSTPAAAPPEAGSPARGRIMVVDDNPDNLNVLESMLVGQGHELQLFPRGRLALAAAVLQAPDLILLDLNMPEMNGYEVCERLKSSQNLSEIPVIILSALDRSEDKVKAFQAGATDYISKPFQIDEVIARVDTQLKLHRLQQERRRVNERLEITVAARTRELAEANERLAILNRSKGQFIRSVARAIEFKDETIGDHLHRVQTYAMGLAAELSLPQDRLEALRGAAILHDIGKVAVREHIISKPGRLTPEEFEEMKAHTVVGAELVESADFPFPIAPLVRAHHEKWDGTGYPDGLKGEEIPLEARILSIVDCLDALTSDRQYRQAMPLEKAMAIIASESGKSFDPELVKALQKHCARLVREAHDAPPPAKANFTRKSLVARGPGAGYAAGQAPDGDAFRLPSRRIRQEVGVLNFIHSNLGKHASIQEDLLAIENQLRQVAPFDCFALYQLRGRQLHCIFAKGLEASRLLGLAIDSGAGSSGWTVEHRTALLNGAATTEFGLGGPADSRFALKSSLSVPLESEFGPVGVLSMYRRQENGFDTGQLRVLQAIGSRLAYQMHLDASGVPRMAKEQPSSSASRMQDRPAAEIVCTRGPASAVDSVWSLRQFL